MLYANCSEPTTDGLGWKPQGEEPYLGFLRASQIKVIIVLLHIIFGFGENSCQLKAWRQCEVGDTACQCSKEASLCKRT